MGLALYNPLFQSNDLQLLEKFPIESYLSFQNQKQEEVRVKIDVLNWDELSLFCTYNINLPTYLENLHCDFHLKDQKIRVPAQLYTRGQNFKGMGLTLLSRKDQALSWNWLYSFLNNLGIGRL